MWQRREVQGGLWQKSVQTDRLKALLLKTKGEEQRQRIPGIQSNQRRETTTQTHFIMKSIVLHLIPFVNLRWL